MLRKYSILFTIIFLSGLFITVGKSVKAQDSSVLKISEILVNNESNCIDDYGSHSSWIEICNLSDNSIDIGGYYLTDDINDLTKCWIPKGDNSTVISPKDFLVLWADGMPTRGILHLNIDLKNAKSLILVNPVGGKIVDKIEIQQPQKPDVTFGRLDIEDGECVYLSTSTPGTINDLSQKTTVNKNVDMSSISNLSVILAIAFGLIVLFVIFIRKRKNDEARSNEKNLLDKNEIEQTLTYEEVLDEVNVAIAMAFYLYENDIHDNENLVLTLQKVSRTYSPWSSKIYMLRKLPR